MAPSPAAPTRRNRMMLLVFGTGVAMGLQSGLLHVFLWHSPTALVTFIGTSLLFSGVVYGLWRWVFPRLTAATLAGQVALQAAVTAIIVGLVSIVTIDAIARLLHAPSLFGTPGGPDIQVTVTPQVRQLFTRLYAVMPIVPTVVLALIGYHQYWLRILALQSRERELTELAATAQLAALRAQINPHFLFNSLNSIAQLIHDDPDKAEVCVERLASLFRYQLNHAEKEFVPLAEELEMVEAYLDIERARFGDRLQVETEVDPRSLRRLIPNLVLQPLVENAIKHGLSPKIGPGTLRIVARVNGALLTLSVRDDGLGMPGGTLAEVYERGIGLGNLRARLERLYGPAHLPEITSVPGGGTQVELRLPLRPLEAAA
jgi:signal transduction histidine kinase